MNSKLGSPPSRAGSEAFVEGVAAVRRSVLLSARPEVALRDIVRLACRQLGADEVGVWNMGSRTWVTDGADEPSARLQTARTQGEIRDGVLRFTVSGHGLELATLVGVWTPPTALDLAACVGFEELSEYAGMALLTGVSSARPIAAQKAPGALDPVVAPAAATTNTATVIESPTPVFPPAQSLKVPAPPPGVNQPAALTAEAEASLRSGMGADRLLGDLRTAIMAGKIEPHYQPILRLSDGRVMAFEALARWQHDDGGWISPAEFIPVAERHGLIATLGMRVLKDVAAQSSVWARRAGDDTRVVVNLSPIQLRSSSLVTEVGNLVRRHHLAPGRLILELTTVGSFDTARTAGLLERFEGAGVRIAVAEPEAVSHLRASAAEVAAGFVKVPRRLVGSVINSAATRREIERLVADGRGVGMSVTAEGIETREELQALMALGVGFGGGFLWSAAVPASDATEMLTSQPWMAGQKV